MGTTPVCTIDATGIHRPTLATCLAYFTGAYQGIYGSDVNLDSDTQDGELMGLLAAAIDDCNAETVSAYNAYSPASAQGAGLASVVKINGLTKDVASYSTVPVLIVGQANLAVPATSLSDNAGNVWTFPATTIPSSGQTTVTATCATLGAISLASGVVLTIMNPTRGLQSATTSAVATVGAPVETDAHLRARQAQSTQAASQTFLGSIVGALAGIANTGRIKPYQNETDAPDANGVPGYSICIVVDGGDPVAIATAILQAKSPCGTYGSTTETIVDSIGVSHAINFDYTTSSNIIWGVTLTPGPQFSTNTIALIQQSLAAWTNALGIGANVQLSRAWSAAYLAPSISAAAANLQAAVAAGDTAGIATYTAQLTSLNSASQTYEVTGLTIAIKGGTLAAADVPIAFNAAAYIAVDANNNPITSSDITVTI